MGLEEVETEILAVANQKGEEILSEGKKEAHALLHDAEERVNAYKKKLKIHEDQLFSEMETLVIASAQTEAKKLLLDSKKEVLDEAFQAAFEKILGAGEANRKEYLRKHLEKAKKEITIATIYCNAKDAKYFKEYPCKETPMQGGFIAENKEGTVQVDYRFETLLDTIKEKELHKLAELLF